MAYKVFTNGSTLQASELNDNLMKQAVATFSNAAARTAAITSPVEGQMTYLEDVNRYDHWNGSAWASPFGMALLTKTSFTSQTSIIVDNVFSSQFDNYKAFFTIFGSAQSVVALVLRAGGADIAAANYQNQQLFARGTAVTAARITNSTNLSFMTQRSGGAQSFGEVTFGNPFNSVNTIFQSYSFDPLTDASLEQDFGMYKATTSATGFKITGDSMSGYISVYGLRN